MPVEVAVEVVFDVVAAFDVAVVFDAAFEFEVRIGTLPNVARVSRELWEDMFEHSELVFPPD